MYKKLQSVLMVVALAAMLAVPLVAGAQLADPNEPITDTNFFENIFGCPAGEGVLCIIGNILQFILAIAFIIAVIFLVVGGFRYIVSQGNEEAVEKAKSTITSAIIGIVVVVLAWIILTIVLNLVQQGEAGEVTLLQNLV